MNNKNKNKNNNKKDEINHSNRSLELEEKLNNSGELSKDYKKRIQKAV